MAIDPNQAIRRWTGDEHLTNSQVAGYYSNLSGIFDQRCGVSSDPGRQLDNYHRALTGFDFVRRISGVPVLHVALPQSFDQFLVSRGCPDSSPREIFHRELIANYVDMSRQVRSRESIAVLAKITDEIRMRRFTAEEEGALSAIRKIMRWGDPFFELVGTRLLGLVWWKDGKPRMPRDFVESVNWIASYDGQLYPMHKFDQSRLAIWEVIDVLEQQKDDDSSSGSVPPAESGAPPAPAAASSGQASGGISWGLPALGGAIASGITYYAETASEWLSGFEWHTSTVTGLLETDETSGTYRGDYAYDHASVHASQRNAFHVRASANFINRPGARFMGRGSTVFAPAARPFVPAH